MVKYLDQLLADIEHATQNVSLPFAESELEIYDWITDDEENKTAPVRNLQEWTQIRAEMLPPESLLTDEQLHVLLEALKNMLKVYNWSFVLQNAVPERIQYAAIRNNFNQEAKVKRWHMGLFEVCKPGTEHKKCALGEYCQCAFFAELFSHFIEEDLSQEEERARALEIEVQYIKRKHGESWWKYYPYHLDKEYDDEDGRPFGYGVGDDDEDEHDDWWKR